MTEIKLKYSEDGTEIILGYPCYGLTSKETLKFYKLLNRGKNSKRFWELNEKVNIEIDRLKDLEKNLKQDNI